MPRPCILWIEAQTPVQAAGVGPGSPAPLRARAGGLAWPTEAPWYAGDSRWQQQGLAGAAAYSLPPQPRAIFDDTLRMQRGHGIWIQVHLTAPPGGGVRAAQVADDAAAWDSGGSLTGAAAWPAPGAVQLGFALDALPHFAAEAEMRNCAQQIVAVLSRYGLACTLHEGQGAGDPAVGRQPPPGARVAWLRAAAASAPAGHGFALGCLPDALPAFASVEARRACAGEIIAVLQRYGIPCTVREDSPSNGEGGS